MRFGHIEGFLIIKNRLIDIVNKDRIPHCQLFYGNEGGASLSIPLAFASYICCKNRIENDSCGNCDGCKKVKALSHPDIYFVLPTNSAKEESSSENISKINSCWREFISYSPYQTATDWSKKLVGSGKNLNIAKYESHTLAKWLSMRSFEAPYKIVFIWLPEYMTISSANAFLKILEEPPLDTVFLLVSNNKDRIIETVLSRSQQIYITDFTAGQVAKTLEKNFSIPSHIAVEVSNISNGDISKALALAEQKNQPTTFQSERLKFFQDWMRYSYKKDFIGLIQLSEVFQKYNTDDQKDFFRHAMQMMKNVCFILLGLDGDIGSIGSTDIDFLRKLSPSLTLSSAKNIINSLDHACYHLDRNANAKVLFMNLSLRVEFIR